MKELYFTMIEQNEKARAELEELLTHWKEHVCWFGSEEEIREYEAKESMLLTVIRDLQESMRHVRAMTTKDELARWKEEYYK